MSLARSVLEAKEPNSHNEEHFTLPSPLWVLLQGTKAAFRMCRLKLRFSAPKPSHARFRGSNRAFLDSEFVQFGLVNVLHIS